jgi:hypothetical protein
LAILPIGKCRSCGNESENDKIFHFLKVLFRLPFR